MALPSTISDLTVVDTKTVEFTQKCGTIGTQGGYVAQEQNYDLTEVLATLGIAAADAHVVSIMSDGSIDTDLSDGGTSGWRDDNGDWANWGSAATWRCQASVSGTTLAFAKVSGHQTRGAHMTDVYTGCVYTAHYAVYSDALQAVQINVQLTCTALEKPTIVTTDDLKTKVGEMDVDIESTIGKSYEKLTATVDIDKVLTALGVATLDDVTIAAIQSDKTLDTDYKLGTTDGWRNADGDWQSWGSSARFCIKTDFTSSPAIYYAGGYPNAGDHLTQETTYTAKYAIYTGTNPDDTKAYYINVNLIYKEPEVAPLTFADLKVADTKNVDIYSTTGKSYEKQTANVDVDAVLSTLSAASISDVDIYAVKADGTLDTDYKLGTTDGWRNADGDWSAWGNDATRFCVKADFTAEPAINYTGGYHAGDHLTSEVTYTATYAFVVGNTAEDNKAVVLKVNLIYEFDKATLAVTDSKYATFIAPFDVTIPEGVTAYTVEGVEGTELTLKAVETTIAANTPVVLYSETPVSTTVKGLSTATEEAYTTGLLTGVYKDKDALVGTYVLQDHDGKVAFYYVGSTPVTVKAGHAYLTAPSSDVKAYGFDAIATAINNLNATKAAAEGTIYNVSGQQQRSLQRGINIVGGKKVVIK